MHERISRLAGGAVLVLALSLGLGSAGAAEREPDAFVYQLQRIDLEAIGETKFDLVIMDYSRDGSDERKFTAAQISALKDSQGGPKTVLSYMSIGEAEDYRWYWQRSWDANRDGRPDAGAPAWLGRSGPDWPGNYIGPLLEPGVATDSLRLRGQGPRCRLPRRLPRHRGRLRVLANRGTRRP